MNIENRITNIEELPLSLTAKDVAKVLGVSLEHAYILIHRKEFPSVQPHICNQIVRAWSTC